MGSFSFEELDVWQKSVDFSNHVIDIVDSLNSDRKHYRLIEQLEASVTSIPTNVAEGKGRFSRKEFVQFLYIARGSLFETITLIEIFRKRGWVNGSEYERIRNEGDEIGKMLSGLIRAIKNA